MENAKKPQDLKKAMLDNLKDHKDLDMIGKIKFKTESEQDIAR